MSGGSRDVYKSKGLDKLKQLARDIVEGKVFHSDCIHEADAHLVRSIFMPLALFKKEDLDRIKDNKISLFYEYMEHAGRRTINGYPMFMSICFLDESDHKTLLDILTRMKKKIQEALDES